MRLQVVSYVMKGAQRTSERVTLLDRAGGATTVTLAEVAALQLKALRPGHTQWAHSLHCRPATGYSGAHVARLGACMSPVGLIPSGQWRTVEDSAPTVCAQARQRRRLLPDDPGGRLVHGGQPARAGAAAVVREARGARGRRQGPAARGGQNYRVTSPRVCVNYGMAWHSQSLLRCLYSSI